MSLPRLALRSMIVGTLAVCLGGSFLLAQQASTAAAPPEAPKPAVPISRFDLFGGYSYIAPQNASVGGTYYKSIATGSVVSATYYFGRYIGAQVEGGFHPYGPNDCIFTGQAGPVLRYPAGRLTPFVHVLGGASKIGGPVFQPCTWGWGMTAGGGLDYLLPILHNHLALRFFQVDYEHAHVDFGAPDQFDLSGGVAAMDAIRASTGIVLKFGNIVPPPPVTISCSISPAEGYPGDPLTITSTPMYLNPKKTATYTWTSTGGKVAGNGPSATLDTAGTAPGSYSVAGHVTEGTKPGQSADCKADFTIKPFPPPTIECAANPTTLTIGDSSTITANAVSPTSRPLTYSYSASAGTVNGSGNTATLATTGAAPGTITVTCNVVDDKGQTASTTTSVVASSPPLPPAPVPQAEKLCSVAFERDSQRPVRVDNEAKACLDDVALALQRQTDAKLVIVGESGAQEKHGNDLAAARALNVRQYLTNEKGIDPARIDVRTSGATGKQVEDYLVPAGATFNQQATEPVDESKVHRKGQPYGGATKASSKTKKPM